MALPSRMENKFVAQTDARLCELIRKISIGPLDENASLPDPPNQSGSRSEVSEPIDNRVER